MKKFYVPMLSVLLIVAFLITPGISKDELSQPTYGVRYELNMRIPMSDGVELSADMYRPDAPGRFPVVLVRTPYDNNNEGSRKMGQYFAQRGYIYITQDTRGRGDSDGRFYPLVNEASDGYDTHEWIGKQEWSNGKIGSTGGSYVGWVQVYAATKKSQYYTAMIPQVTPPDPFFNVPYQNGAFMMAMLDWIILIDGRTMQDLSKHNLQEIYNLLPLADMEKAVGRNTPFWKDWLDHFTWDEYWDKQCYQEKLWKV
ncbi:MAG: CocE/NonD family hydrolase, partial [Candidatus Aminicenantes bacterium]|nr:CocE/NonD family hydrolase [Candidatus Aminicenantes bacterium]